MAKRNPINFVAPVRRGLWLVLLLVAVASVWALFGSRINRTVATALFLRARSPSEESFEALLAQAADPAGFLERCWKTDKIPHRQLVISCLRANAASDPPWFAQAEPLLLLGAMDPDMSIRELSLAGLDMRHDPHLFEAAQAQFKDVDPMIRQLGLQYLRKADARTGVVAVTPLLDDPDLQVVTRAESALARWTGQDFGVRVSMALRAAARTGGSSQADADVRAIRDGVALRKRWLAEHASEFGSNGPTTTLGRQAAERVEDFSLPSVTGATVRLSSLRGRVVILNFWATWCTACLVKIPELDALQHDLGDRIALLGISLDGLPDEHHHPENAAREAEEHSIGKSLREIQTKVSKAVAVRGINYTVLLDPAGSVGGRFNGGELPTTVLIDPAGRVRRRFIGGRSLSVLKAMVAEAARSQDPQARSE